MKEATDRYRILIAQNKVYNYFPFIGCGEIYHGSLVASYGSELQQRRSIVFIQVFLPLVHSRAGKAEVYHDTARYCTTTLLAALDKPGT